MIKGQKRQIFSITNLINLPPLTTRIVRSPKIFRALAAHARRRGDWTADLFYRRTVCRIEPDRGNNWIQFGHSLKEVGFYHQAETAYSKGLSLLPGSSDIHVQLAHLTKLRGNFDSAKRHFTIARELGHPDTQSIDWEMELLVRIENAEVYPGKNSDVDGSGIHIYLSAPVRSIREDDKDSLSSGLGRSDYSYAFAMRGFIRALDTLGYNFTIVPNPEFVSDIRDRSNANINIHIGFYPPEKLRLLKGAYNINCFAWEFDRLRSSAEVLNYHAFSDQATMLNLLDEIWVPSTHGAKAVAQSVTRPVYAIPAPVLGDLRISPRNDVPDTSRVRHLSQKTKQVAWQPLAILARIQHAMNEEAGRRESRLPDIVSMARSGNKPLIFLTILNVHDFRKQLYPMLQGFLEFQATNPDALLLVKMTTPDRGKLAINSFLLMDQVSDAGELPRPLVSDHVWITDQILSREDMNQLYDLGAFYVCTSYAEGQNLPLLEAMGRGMVPVSVNNTAMADYITDATAIPIPSRPRPFGPRLASRYGMYGMETNLVESADVRQAFERAAALTPEEYASRSACALAIVQRDYGIDPIARALGRVIDTIQANIEETTDA